jgi:glutamine amidotransferase
LLEAENALSTQAQRHPDGWGIGWFVDDGAHVVKSSTAAHACERFRRASQRLESHTFIVHVRRATVGTVDHLNAHPFRFGRWLFAHNGTIFGFDECLRAWMLARTSERFHPLILGDTDSEHLFFYLLTALDRAGVDRTGEVLPDAAAVSGVLRSALGVLTTRALDHGTHRPIINVLMTDGRIFVAHRAGMPLFLSTQKTFCADFDSCAEPSKVCMLGERPNAPVNHLLIASEPIDETENRWEELADGATVYLQDDFTFGKVDPPRDWIAPFLPAELMAPK